jgi:exosortase
MNSPWKGSFWIPAAIFALLWFDLYRNLSFHWSTNPQYAYGWTVPALSAFLLWEAWVTRPAPGIPAGRSVAVLTAVFSSAVLLPAKLQLEATPDWRLPQWTMALAVVTVSLSSVYLVGGRAWLGQFAFGIAFNLVAVPWLGSIEIPFVQGLTQVVSSLTVAGLNLCHIPALKQGNLIEISTGVVGVEEACSGVRSFQATLMASLFLGQLWTMRLRSRVFLIVAGALMAFVCNVVRASLLAFVAEKEGIAAIDRWHDPAGFTILGVTFAGLLALALYLRPPSGRRLAAPNIAPAGTLPRWLVAGLGLWVVAVAAGTELWFRSGRPAFENWWKVEWPDGRPGYAEIPVTESLREGLRFDYARQGRWREGDQTAWTMYFFRWFPGVATARISARSHRPEICLPSAGFTLVEEFDAVPIRVADTELFFRSYHFDNRGRPVFVFFCVWEDRRDPAEAPGPMREWTRESRWNAVMSRKRRLGQQVLEVVLEGVADERAARAALEKHIVPLLRPDPSVRVAAPGE